jgi:hypothetical protein
MLSKLAYLTLCRSIQLLALAARGDAVKDLEIGTPSSPPRSTRSLPPRESRC